MNTIIILICKIAQFILNLLKRGTAYPGSLALKLNKDILSYFKLPEKTIFITGTTGKTSISGMITTTYENLGYTVSSNVKGSNLIGGVTSALIKNCKLNGKIKSDVVVIEIDERYVKKVFKYITPNYFVINNLSRDQLARNGHFEIVLNEINKSINEKTHLVLNADDPLVTSIAIDRKNKVTYYGVSKNKLSTKDNDLKKLDARYCPICHRKLSFDYFNYGNLGNYTCPNNDFNRPKTDYEANIISEDKFKIEDINITMHNKALYNVYNLMACYTICKLTGLNNEQLENALNNLSLKVERLTTFKLDKIDGTILLSKNETPLSYNQSLEYLTKDKNNKTVAIGFTRISGRYDLKDLSWLYDINFELLNNDSVKKIILIGPFAYDLAVRLKQAGIDASKFLYCLDYEQTLDYLIKKVKGKLYCVFYFDMDKKLRKQLIERGVKF